MAECKYPGCDWDEPSRPYARSGLMSVTSAINSYNWGDRAKAFAWSASGIATYAAVHETDWSVPLPDDEYDCTGKQPNLGSLCRRIRSKFDREWSEKSVLGSHVHHLAVSWAQGKEITSTPEIDPYLDILEAFYKDFHPEWLELERTVYFRQFEPEDGPLGIEYVGTFDAIAELHCPVCPDFKHCAWLLDIKTGAGRHDNEWALQLAAYRWASYLTRWEKGKRWEQVIDRPMPAIDHCGVIHLHPDANEPLIWLEVTAEHHEKFLQLVDLAIWDKAQQKKERDEKASHLPVDNRCEHGIAVSGSVACILCP